MKNRETKLGQTLIDNGYNKMLTNLLINRGYDEEIITALLSTGYSDELPLYNDLTNVEIGADIIESHIANGSDIYIFGDYDSDGVNSSYILGDAINNIIYNTESTSTINIKLPERHEGYGLNYNWCKSLVENKSNDILVVTVDNGIAQEREVAYLLENGIDVLITDHHTPNGHTPKNVFIIDAFHNNDSVENKGLCGAGVAFKLAMTLLDRYDIEYRDDLYYRYLIHVAIATITDSMPMTIENIKYVYNGVQLLKDGYGSPAIDYYRTFNSNTELTPKDIAFGLGPQINSCGRMNNTGLALDYLFADDEEVEDLYNAIVETNDKRKTKTKKAIEIAEEMINIKDLGIAIQLSDVEGIAGIIASNLSDKYNKCTIVFSQINDVLVGSARSEGFVNLLQVLKQIESETDYVVKLGGHANACGLTIKKSSFEEFKKLYNNKLAKILINKPKEEKLDINVVVDDMISISDINKDNCDTLRSLYFFTESNPVFALKDITIKKVKYSNNNMNNVQFTITDGIDEFSFWTWGIGSQYKQLGEPKQVVLIGELDNKFGKPSFNILNIIPKGDVVYE
jgi:single-stranded-DNA-specific exonuclease